MADTIQIEVAYALEEVQYLFSEQVEQGTTVAQALEQSKLLQELPGLVTDKVGIFGKLVTPDTILREGDRIEVYRPLKVDPRDRRRQKVEEERKAAK
ncbi:RnfH family protein [Thiomicrorhabdus sp. Kp2]|uniref:RnfH family protein n=1 Tax=Thiomicrorhabdus sp. Kp2 TaxID=1123518 RepID=UPI0003FF9AD2|nr:RnfH family protein [Thiomicrorhabdus sp. Kp2]